MKPNGIEDFLAFEIKKEIAERYFGLRKLIERDKEILKRKVKQHSLTLEQEICFDLVRIYILLKDEKLIHEFLDLTGLEESFFYDPYLTESPTIRKKVFQGFKVRGLTRAGRFKNLIIDSYEMLVEHVKQHREEMGELVESHEVINEEIKLFYKKNDINNILGFLRGIDSSFSPGSELQGGINIGYSNSIKKKMHLEPLKPIDMLLPIIPPIIPYSNISREMKKLIDRAYKFHGGSFLVEPIR